MGNVEAFANYMNYWCSEGNLGYDQSNRWDIRYGGECDCSSLVIFCARSAGFDVGGATYTGNMSREFTARGWERLAVGTPLQRGDILLADWYHVAVYLGDGMIAQASIDERGEISGGQSGDQIDYETNVRGYYNYPWDCILRFTGQQTVVAGPGAGSGYNPNGYGEAYVMTVQKLLNSKGYRLEEDGILGALTFAAVKDYQGKHGLEVDGIPGPETMGSLKSPDDVAPASRSNARKQHIIDVDGIWGKETTLRAQVVAGTTQDYIVSSQYVGNQQFVPGAGSGWEWVENAQGSELIAAIQEQLNRKTGANLVADGIYGSMSVYWHQRALGVDADQIAGAQTIKRFQTCLNEGKLF